MGVYVRVHISSAVSLEQRSFWQKLNRFLEMTQRNALHKNSPPKAKVATATDTTPTSSDEIKVFDDGTTSFFWQAHTITALAVVACVLIYITAFDELTDDTNYNMRRGTIAVVVVFLLIGTIHMPSGPFIRPHPMLWKLVLSVNILYVLLLIFTMFQTVDDARQFLKLFDPDLGVPLPERSYADECSIYTPGHPNGSFHNVFDKMDVFVPSHFFGWWVKGLILRNMFLLNIISVGFEVLEYTLEPQLPNFGECWWDHWILDFLLCNGLGLWLGIKTCEFLEMRSYHWRGLWKIPSLKGKIKRAVSQFTPYSWRHYQWGYTGSFTRFVAVSIMVAFWLLMELNTFYLKAVFWIPPNHSLNFYRVLLYAFSGSAATFEIYDYLSTSDKNAVIGRFSWLMLTSIIVELLLEIKMGRDIVSIPLHPLSYVIWGVGAAVFLFWVFWHFTLPFRDMPFIGRHYRRLQKKFKKT